MALANPLSTSHIRKTSSKVGFFIILLFLIAKNENVVRMGSVRKTGSSKGELPLGAAILPAL
jgi:hypothetical protein